jgi:hypothetical protein
MNQGPDLPFPEGREQACRVGRIGQVASQDIHLPPGASQRSGALFQTSRMKIAEKE